MRDVSAAWVDIQDEDATPPSVLKAQVSTTNPITDPDTTVSWLFDNDASDNLIEGSIVSAFDPSTTSLPFESVTLKVENGAYQDAADSDYDFNATPVKDALRYPGKINVELGYRFDSGTVETTAMTSQGLKPVTVSDDDLYATIAAESFVSRLEDSTFYGGRYAEGGIPASTLFDEILTDAAFQSEGEWQYVLGEATCKVYEAGEFPLWNESGFDYWVIDPKLASVMVHIPIPAVSHREALVMLAAYSGAYLIHDSSGVLHITTSLDAPVDYHFDIDRVYERPTKTEGIVIGRVNGTLQSYRVESESETIVDRASLPTIIVPNYNLTGWVPNHTENLTEVSSDEIPESSGGVVEFYQTHTFANGAKDIRSQRIITNLSSTTNILAYQVINAISGAYAGATLATGATVEIGPNATATLDDTFAVGLPAGTYIITVSCTLDGFGSAEVITGVDHDGTGGGYLDSDLLLNAGDGTDATVAWWHILDYKEWFDESEVETGSAYYTLTHDAAEGETLTLNGADLIGDPVFNTYSTVFQARPKGASFFATLTGRRVTIDSINFGVPYTASGGGEVRDFNNPIASDALRTKAMFDRYVNIAGQTTYEFGFRDDPAVEVGDRVYLDTIGAPDGFPVMVVDITRNFNGGTDGTYRVITDPATSWVQSDLAQSDFVQSARI